MKPKIEIILASVPEDRRGEKVARSTDVAPQARAWVERIAAADGFVVVTPEYNHGYPPSLKNALNRAYTPWNAKPIAFVSCGGPGAGLARRAGAMFDQLAWWAVALMEARERPPTAVA